MDFIDRLTNLSARIKRQKDAVMTEEATKTAFILPFLQTLGYDVFNPDEVVPEFTADVGVKKGEKVDYAIKQDGKPIILIECKPVGAALEVKHASQLYRYFSVESARFGVLTDGIRYLFYSDLENTNKMDSRPFFDFDLTNFTESQVEELKKFTKTMFDIDTIVGSAEKLKYHRALIAEIKAEFESPSDELVKHFTTKVYPGRFTQKIQEDFSPLVKIALHEHIRQRVNDRLKSALDTDSQETDQERVQQEAPANDTGIETTEHELLGHRIVRAIAAEVAEPERITIRDAKSYCAILFDDNNRRPICRFFFGKKRLSISIFTSAGEIKHELANVRELYKHKALVLEAVQQYV